MQLSPSAHTDTFCRDNLPPADQWPELRFDLPELRYPDRLNCAEALLDATVARLGPQMEFGTRQRSKRMPSRARRSMLGVSRSLRGSLYALTA